MKQASVISVITEWEQDKAGVCTASWEGAGAPTPRPAAPPPCLPGSSWCPTRSEWVLGPPPDLDNGSPETLALTFWPLPKSPPHAATSPSDAVGQREDCPRRLPHTPLPPACHLCRGLLTASLLARPTGPTSKRETRSTPHHLCPSCHHSSHCPLSLDSQPLNAPPASHPPTPRPSAASSGQSETFKRKSVFPHHLNPLLSLIPFRRKCELLAVVSETLCDLALACL